MVDYANLIAENESRFWNVRDDLKGKSLDEIREIQPKNGFAICMFNVSGDLNVGTALRSAVLFGASKFYIVGRRRFDKRSTVGAQNYINLEKIECMKDETEIDYVPVLEKIQKDGYTPILIETGDESIQGIKFQFLKASNGFQPCFIFGNEGLGLPEDLLKENYPKFSIPQLGVLRSFNVSTAASLVMYEWMR